MAGIASKDCGDVKEPGNISRRDRKDPDDAIKYNLGQIYFNLKNMSRRKIPTAF